MAEKITDALVKALPIPEKGYSITYDGGHDKAVRGFGVRVTAKGVKSFVLNYRSKGSGTERRLTIGQYSPSAWSVEGARKHAGELRRKIDAGEDPLAELHEQRAAPTMADLCDRFETEFLPKKSTSWQNDCKAIIATYIKPKLGKMKVAEVRHADVERMHNAITKAGSPVRANRVLAVASKMFSLAVRWEMRSDNPAKGIERNPEDRRERYLTGDELRRLLDVLNSSKRQSSANAIRLLLLTGARSGEVMGATWDQFDLEAGIWTKPSAHTKQRKTHRVPLSAPALELLSKMQAAADDGVPYLFPERNRKGELVAQSRLKTYWQSVRKDAGIPDVRLHDLRHTYASILASAGLSLPIIGQLLGHTQPATTARYSHLLDDPLRAATERAGQVITGDKGQSADVVEIGQGRG